MKQKIAIIFAYLLAIVAIVISLLRCEPFTIDYVAILATILSLLVTILLGIIAYNYFIQKDEVKKYKKELSDSISTEILDIYIGIMSSFGVNKNSLSLFPLGVKVLRRIEGNKEQDISQICNLLLVCYNNMTVEEKRNPIIIQYLSQLKLLLRSYKNNDMAVQLLSSIENE